MNISLKLVLLKKVSDVLIRGKRSYFVWIRNEKEGNKVLEIVILKTTGLMIDSL